MPTPIRSTQTFDCSPEEFWEIYFDDEFIQRMAQRIRLREMTILSREESADRVHFRVRVVPDREMPAAVSKVIKGATAAYVEERTWHKKERYISWRIVPGMVPDKVQATGTVRIVPEGGGCRRLLEGTIQVKIFGVGKLIEKAVASGVNDSYERSAALVREEIVARRARS